MSPHIRHFGHVWLELLDKILMQGRDVAPRGKPTKELPQHTIVVPMRRPVLTVPERKLNYKFMAAEAYWILTGDNRVSTISPYNPHIAQFSDDGETYFGAYGPKVVDQLPYVVDTLIRDPDSRQAGLTIWREKPPITKDVPCTVAAFFNIRENYVNAHFYMRSSDAWLGVPYDVFNFTAIAFVVMSRLNAHYAKAFAKPRQLGDPPRKVDPYRLGELYLTMASSHLYETNWADAKRCTDLWKVNEQWPLPEYGNEDEFMVVLKNLRDSKPGDSIRWWETR